MSLSGPSSLFRHAACQRYASAPAVHEALTRSIDPAGALVSPCSLASDALSYNSTCLVPASYLLCRYLTVHALPSAVLLQRTGFWPGALHSSMRLVASRQNHAAI